MNKTVFSGWLVLLLALSSSLVMAQGGPFSAVLDRDHIGLEDTFTLTLRYQGQTNESPDLNPLRQEFDIIHTQQGSHMQNINGQISSYQEWRLVMAPKKSGVFTLPALSLGQHTTQPLLITVDPQRNAGRSGSGSDIFVELETDRNTAHVQEQIILTLRLITPFSLDQLQLDSLDIDNALVVPLDEKQYQTQIQGTPHGVIETRIAIFPQRSGTLTIPSLTYQVWVASGRRSLLSQFYGTPSGNMRRLRTEEKHITVKGIPAEFSGLPWLPVSDLTLEEHWSHSHDNLTAGEPVTRSIKIIAQGLTPGQIPPLTTTALDGLTFYPDQAQTDEQKSAQGVIGTRIETQAIVPTQGGRYTLPAIQLKWWDTVNQQVRTAELPARELRVADNPMAISTPQLPTTGVLNQPAGDAGSTQIIRIDNTPRWLIAVSIATSLLSVLLAFLYWRSRSEIRAIRQLFTAEREEEQLAEDKAWRLLKRASADGDLPGLRKAVLTWARIHWRDQQLHSLQAVAAATRNPQLREHLLKLDAALYGSQPPGTWDSGELLQAIYACKKEKRDAQKDARGLSPLYQGQ